MPPHPSLPDCVIFLLAKAFQYGHGLLKRPLAAFQLTNMQHLVLEGLWLRPGQTASELGRMLILDKATLSGVLDRMEEAGWISRRSDPADRRMVRLFPSVRAEEARPELIRLRHEVNEALLAPLGLEERCLLRRMLWDLVPSLEQDSMGGAPSARGVVGMEDEPVTPG